MSARNGQLPENEMRARILAFVMAGGRRGATRNEILNMLDEATKDVDLDDARAEDVIDALIRAGELKEDEHRIRSAKAQGRKPMAMPDMTPKPPTLAPSHQAWLKDFGTLVAAAQQDARPRTLTRRTTEDGGDVVKPPPGYVWVPEYDRLAEIFLGPGARAVRRVEDDDGSGSRR